MVYKLGVHASGAACKDISMTTLAIGEANELLSAFPLKSSMNR